MDNRCRFSFRGKLNRHRLFSIFPGNDLTGELPDNGFDADGRPRREYYKEPGWVKHISTWLNLKSKFAFYVQQRVVIAWRRMVRTPGPPRHFFLSFLGFSIVTNYRTYTLYLLSTTKATTTLVKRCEDVPQRFSFPPNAELAIRPSPPILMRWPWCEPRTRCRGSGGPTRTSPHVAADATVIRQSRALLQAIATECWQRGTKLCILVVGPVAPYYCEGRQKPPRPDRRRLAD